jgi:Ca-activated chloride channel family protein
MRVFATIAGICLLAVSALTLSLQDPKPVEGGLRVTGSVAGPAGEALAGVRIELVRDGFVQFATATDRQGGFVFENIPPAVYRVRAILRGFATVEQALTIGTAPVPAIRLTLSPSTAQNEARDRIQVNAPPPPAQRAPTPRPPAVEALKSADSARAHSAGMSIAGSLLSPAPFNTESYARIDDNRFHRVTEQPLSTFSIDADTASYANVRRFLNEGRLPPADAVRTEELINYFRFAYPDARRNAPFSVTTEVAACPWNPRHRLALVGLQATKLETEATPPRNLVFLLDVSGSMQPADKLPLVKNAMRMLVDTLTPADRVAIVVYAGASGLALPSTSGAHKERIQRAIAELTAGGSTNGAAGIRLAYNTAAEAFVKRGINRVILATDGDFNVGVTSEGELTRLIEEERERGIFLSVLGVGTGNLKDSTMEKLADRGNGNYAYLDSLHEARRVLIAEAGATLVTVAKDVKIQVEFNPRTVGAYRLIGYENRLLNKEDFNDDKKDAGEIGAGHTVTALYELIPPGEPSDGPGVDPLKYQDNPRRTEHASSDELMTVKVRYKAPTANTSELLTVAVKDRTSELSPNIGFAAAVSEFGMLLRRSEFKGDATWSSAKALAKRFRGEDPDGYRAEFVRLLDVAAALDAQTRPDGDTLFDPRK